MYTIVGVEGARDLVLEHGLSGLESQFATLRETKLRHQKPMEMEEHLTLCTFVAAMDSRTKARREHTRREMGRVVDLIDRMHEAARTFTPEQIESMKRRAEIEEKLSNGNPTMSEEEVRRIADKPMQELLGSRNLTASNGREWRGVELLIASP